mgnify:CR=1
MHLISLAKHDGIFVLLWNLGVGVSKRAIPHSGTSPTQEMVAFYTLIILSLYLVVL